MGEFFNQIPDHIQAHVRDLVSASDMPDDEEYLELISEAWLEKKRIFEEQIETMNMEEIETFEQVDDRGILALTYSGSLINIGPKIDDNRQLEYTSVGLRADVPDSVVEPNTDLAGDIVLDEPINFSHGRVKNTSAIFKITVLKDDLEPEEQLEKIGEVTQILLDEFADVNKTIILDS